MKRTETTTDTSKERPCAAGCRKVNPALPLRSQFLTFPNYSSLGFRENQGSGMISHIRFLKAAAALLPIISVMVLVGLRSGTAAMVGQSSGAAAPKATAAAVSIDQLRSTYKRPSTIPFP